MTSGLDVTFVQFSDKLLTPNERMRDYYARAFTHMPGYVLPSDYFEIPYWIPVVAGRLPRESYQHHLMVIDNPDVLRDDALGRDADATTYMFSVLEANLPFVLDFVRFASQRVVLGGYTDPTDFAGIPNVAYLADLDELTGMFPGARPDAVCDYSLFKGIHCIPRFSLSSGCSFRCKFCTVPTALTLTDSAHIRGQAQALEPLDFELVFLDDKSFGEAPNWRQVAVVREEIEAFNPDFRGFIVQTPPSLACRPGFLAEAKEFGVRYVEFGVDLRRPTVEAVSQALQDASCRAGHGDRERPRTQDHPQSHHGYTGR